MQAIRESWLARLRRDQRGMTTVEYVVVLCLIMAVSVGVWNKFGNTVYKRLSSANTSFETSVSTTAGG